MQHRVGSVGLRDAVRRGVDMRRHRPASLRRPRRLLQAAGRVGRACPAYGLETPALATLNDYDDHPRRSFSGTAYAPTSKAIARMITKLYFQTNPNFRRLRPVRRDLRRTDVKTNPNKARTTQHRTQGGPGPPIGYLLRIELTFGARIGCNRPSKDRALWAGDVNSRAPPASRFEESAR